MIYEHTTIISPISNKDDTAVYAQILLKTSDNIDLISTYLKIHLNRKMYSKTPVEQSTQEYIISPAGFKMETNVGFIPHYSFRESYNTVPAAKNLFDNNKDIKIEYRVEPIAKRKSLQQYSFFQKTGDREIYFDRKIGPFEMRFLLNYGEKVTIRVNKEYHNLIPTHIGNLAPPGDLLTDISRIMLLEQGLVPLHCSSFIDDDTGYVIFGPSGAGKTSVVQTSIKTGGKLLSEDIAISDGTMVFGCPYTFTAAGEINQVDFEKITHKLFQKFCTAPIIGHYFRSLISKNLPLTADGTTPLSKTTPDTILLLMPNTEFSIQNLSSKYAIHQIRNFNRSAFLSRSGLLPALDYFGIIDLDSLMETERSIIENIVQNATELIALHGSPGDFTNYIKDVR